LILPTDYVAPYDLRIKDLTKGQRSKLVALVRDQVLKYRLQDNSVCVSLCDADYNDVLGAAGLKVASRAVESLSRAEKHAWLRAEIDPHRIEATLDSAYESLSHLVTTRELRPLREALARKLPASGVYIFFDPMQRRLRDTSVLRIVRIGTHGVASGSKASLRSRLRTHLGSSTGSGNHRSSIFRLHVGRALINSGDVKCSETWGSVKFPEKKADIRSEAQIEKRVSEYIGNLLVSFIEVPGDSSKHNERAYLEQNLISIVSNVYRPLDPPSGDWLGTKSNKHEIARSGIWNVNHTAQSHDADFLNLLEYYVSFTLGKANLGPKPFVSPEWAANVRRNDMQLSLL
jgi:hypothetical protein